MAAVYDVALSRVEAAGLHEWCRELLAPLSGSVIELGAGTGAKVGLYRAAVTDVVLVEPDSGMRSRLAQRVANWPGGASRYEVVPAKGKVAIRRRDL